MNKSQSADKRFYWIKLQNSLMTDDAIRFLMGQKKGSDYTLLYLLLCLRTANTNGRLEFQVGEFIVPFDALKITQEIGYFDYDTVVIALDLYKKLKLVYEESDGVLQIADFENMVGSETYWAERKRVSRQKNSEKLVSTDWTKSKTMSSGVQVENSSVDNLLDNVQTKSKTMSNGFLTSPPELDKVQDNVQDKVQQENRQQSVVNNTREITIQRTREEWRELITENCNLARISEITKMLFGTDYSVKHLLDILLSFLSDKKDIVIDGIEYDYFFIADRIANMESGIYCDMTNNFYERDDTKPTLEWKQKVITNPRNYFIKIIIKTNKI